MFTTTAYLIYIVISAIVTVVVSRTLSKNGETYLIDGFNGNEVLAKSVNHMLLVGFYLLNLGFVLLRMKTNVLIDSIEGLIVCLSSGIGFALKWFHTSKLKPNSLTIHKYLRYSLIKPNISRV